VCCFALLHRRHNTRPNVTVIDDARRGGLKSSAGKGAASTDGSRECTESYSRLGRVGAIGSSNLLGEAGILTVLDLLGLGMLVDAFGDYLAARDDIEREGAYTGRSPRGTVRFGAPIRR